MLWILGLQQQAYLPRIQTEYMAYKCERVGRFVQGWYCRALSISAGGWCLGPGEALAVWSPEGVFSQPGGRK
jgi:hypothetical protein